MARSLRSLVKSWFQTGDVPTQAQYSDTIDSSVYWEDDIEHTLTNDADKVPASDAVYAAIGAVPTPNLQDVTNAGATTTNSIDVLALNIIQGTEQVSFASNGQIDFTPDTTTPANKTTLLITAATANNNIVFKDESGTVAFLSDITGAGVASVTGNIVDNTDPANPDASLTAANVHTFVDSLTALVTPADADKMIIVDNSASLAKKITWVHIKDTLKSYFDSLYSPIATARNLYITTGDQSKTATSTPTIANITGLSVPTSANKRYAFEGFMRVGCNATGGIKFAVTAPAGSTVNFGFMGPANPNVSNGVPQFISASATLTTFALANAVTNIGIIKVFGEVSTGATTGTINFGFDSSVNTQTSTIYQSGTNIIFTER